MTPLMLFATLATMLYTLTGCVAFIVTYRPVWPWHHGVYGRNLLYLCWCLAAWIVVALVQLVVPMPMWLALLLQLVAFLGMGTVMWRRVFLVPRARREWLERRLDIERG